MLVNKQKKGIFHRGVSLNHLRRIFYTSENLSQYIHTQGQGSRVYRLMHQVH